MYSPTYNSPRSQKLKIFSVDQHAQYIYDEISRHKQIESERQEALNEKLKTEKQKDQIKSGGWSVADVQVGCPCLKL